MTNTTTIAETSNIDKFTAVVEAIRAAPDSETHAWSFTRSRRLSDGRWVILDDVPRNGGTRDDYRHLSVTCCNSGGPFSLRQQFAIWRDRELTFYNPTQLPSGERADGHDVLDVAYEEFCLDGNAPGAAKS